jgi:hypothetical protein
MWGAVSTALKSWSTPAHHRQVAVDGAGADLSLEPRLNVRANRVLMNAGERQIPNLGIEALQPARIAFQTSLVRVFVQILGRCFP